MSDYFVQGEYFVMDKPRRSRRWFVVILTAALVAGLAFIPAAALAAKGGNGKGNVGGGSSTLAWVSAAPNPAPAGGSRVELTGCGYGVNYPAEVRFMHSAGYTEAYAVAVWYTSCMNPTPFLTREAGTYTIEVFQRQRQIRKGMLLKASTVLSVA